MTLAEAIEKLRKRIDYDLESEEDLTNDPERAARELSKGAKEVSRECYHLYTSRANLTLTQDKAEYNLLDPNVCEKEVFDLVAYEDDPAGGVHIAGSWLTYQKWETFRRALPDYFKETSSTPAFYTIIPPSTLRISPPPNSSAVSASDNFVVGFYLHPTYTWAKNKDTELLGDELYHDLYINRALLSLVLANLDDENAKRWSLFRAEYEARVNALRAFNLAKYKPLRRKAGAGNERVLFHLGEI